MATLKLPNASSVVDYLNEQKKDSSFSARKKMFTDMGMNSRLGDYVGSESQNLSFLKQLRATDAPAPPKTSATMQGPINFSQFKNTTPAASLVPGGPLAPSPAFGASSVLNMAQRPQVPPPAAQSMIPTQTTAASLLQSRPSPMTESVTAREYETPSGTRISVDATGNVGDGATASPDETTSAQYDAQTAASYGISASDIIPEFNASEADLVNDYLESEEGNLLTERLRLGQLNAEAAAEEARASLDAKYATDMQTLEQNLAESGLAFSGIRTTQLKALADNLASSQLGVDREFASKLLDADLDLREGILKGVAELVKDAQAKDKDALQQLNAVGLALINGQLVPTLAARSAERSERQLEMSERRLELAEQSAARAEARFEQLYGAGSGALIESVQGLIERAPNATEQDIRLAIRSNPQVFGDPSEQEIEDAVSLVGMPPATKLSFVAQQVKNDFDSVKSFKLTRDQELAKAKEATKQWLLDSGGSLQTKGGDDKIKTWSLNSDQLNDLITLVDDLTLEDLQDL